MRKIMLVIVTVALVAAVVWWLGGRPSGPEPILHGRDTCAACRMVITQRGFAAEARDARGQFQKYDDVGCLVKALAREPRPADVLWVEDQPSGELVPLAAASVVAGSALTTPMDFGFVAFRERSAAEELMRSRGGRLLTPEELLREKVGRKHAGP